MHAVSNIYYALIVSNKEKIYFCSRHFPKKNNFKSEKKCLNQGEIFIPMQCRFMITLNYIYLTNKEQEWQQQKRMDKWTITLVECQNLIIKTLICKSKQNWT